MTLMAAAAIVAFVAHNAQFHRVGRRIAQRLELGPATINQRLAALRAWAHFVATQSPEHLEWSTQVQTIHLKKCPSAPVSYLEKAEMQALLNQPDREAPQGLRDYGLLLFFCTNTGARASEVSRLTVADSDSGNAHGHAALAWRENTRDKSGTRFGT